jgi:predicted DNA-binding transcriptional regulator AlpA
MSHTPLTTAILLTQDVAEQAGITPSTVRSYLARREMPAPDGQIGGKFNYWHAGRADLTEWIASRPSNNPTEETP